MRAARGAAARRRGLGVLALAAALSACGGGKDRKLLGLPGMSSTDTAKGLFAVLATSRGEIEVRLLPEEAPKAVANFTDLATGKKEWTDPATGQKVARRLYDGTLFFRVIPGFVVQGGDPLNTGAGGPGFSIEDEIKPERVFDRPGLVGMASPGPNAAGSQFFITLGPAPWLNGKHTVFGEVVRGLERAYDIASAPRARIDLGTGRPVDRPLEPQVLKEVRVERR